MTGLCCREHSGLVTYWSCTGGKLQSVLVLQNGYHVAFRLSAADLIKLLTHVACMTTLTFKLHTYMLFIVCYTVTEGTGLCRLHRLAGGGDACCAEDGQSRAAAGPPT